MINPIDFIHDLRWNEMPADVQHQAKRCLLDTIGVAAGGRQTELSQLIYNHAAIVAGGSGGYLWFDGREISMAGAVMAHGMSIDSLDMHDSCRPVKGHAGVSQIPAAFATLGLELEGSISGVELLTTVAMAYDVAIRSGTAQHATCPDYHASGSWNALGCAAIVARRLGLNREKTRHALGIAEYHAPRSQMMRNIDHPTMVKDGAFGGFAGISAGLLAADGFTGAPALTVESAAAAPYWADLGERWSLMIQYFKPYAVCYWAQPAIAAARNLQRQHHIPHQDIVKIKVHAFHEAYRLAMRAPQKSDEAQYSLPFPLAGALVHGRLGLEELSGDALRHPDVLRLSNLVELIDDDAFNARFPADRLSRVIIDTKDGANYDSGETRAWWDLTTPPSDEELLAKFRDLTGRYLPAGRGEALEEMIWHIEQMPSVQPLAQLLAQPAPVKKLFS